MNKILEVHHNLKNNSSQTRVIERNFNEYVIDLLNTEESEPSQLIQDLHNKAIGYTLAKPETITRIIHDSKNQCFTLEKFNSFTKEEVIVSLMVIE